MCALPRHSPLGLPLCYFTDPAFRDRADIIQYIGLPPIEAIFDMLRGSLVELIRKGIVAEMVGFLVLACSHSLLTSRQDIPDRRTISLWKNATVAGLSDVTGWKAAAELWGIAELCKVSLSLPLWEVRSTDWVQTGSFRTGLTPSPRSRPCRINDSRQILFRTHRTEESYGHKWGDCETA